jgi:hypothetical protein
MPTSGVQNANVFLRMLQKELTKKEINYGQRTNHKG